MNVSFLVDDQTLANIVMMSLTEKLRNSSAGLLGWVAIFFVGFVIGYGLMSFAIKEPSAEVLAPVVKQVQAEPMPIELPSMDVEKRSPVAAEKPSSQAPPAPKETAPPAKPEKIEEVSPAKVVPEIPRPWWETCQDRRCRLDFGGIKGNLTIRKASLVHGSTIDWDADMSTKPRIESLPTERPLELHVKAIAMSDEGKPLAAEIVWRRRGKDIRGVITLDLGESGKRIVMHP